MNKARCVIFGGGGFIGSHLVEKLIEEKYLVTVFNRRPKKTYKNLLSIKEKFWFIQGDIKNSKLLKEVIKSNDIVFDLIASSVPYSSMQAPGEEINNHISSHFKLIQYACTRRAKKIIFFSSGGGVYGKKIKLPISEEEVLQPISPHAISKVTIEHFLHYFCKMNDVPYIIYRLSNPYGPRQVPKKGFGIIPTIFSHILRNKTPVLFDNGRLIRDFIYIDDLIDGVIKSFDKNTKHHTYNIGSGKGTSLNALWREIKRITKTNLNPQFEAKRPIDVDSVALNIARFKKEFNWSPKTKLSEGLKRTWTATKS